MGFRLPPMDAKKILEILAKKPPAKPVDGAITQAEVEQAAKTNPALRHLVAKPPVKVPVVPDNKTITANNNIKITYVSTESLKKIIATVDGPKKLPEGAITQAEVLQAAKTNTEFQILLAGDKPAIQPTGTISADEIQKIAGPTPAPPAGPVPQATIRRGISAGGLNPYTVTTPDGKTSVNVTATKKFTPDKDGKVTDLTQVALKVGDTPYTLAQLKGKTAQETLGNIAKALADGLGLKPEETMDAAKEILRKGNSLKPADKPITLYHALGLTDESNAPMGGPAKGDWETLGL